MSVEIIKWRDEKPKSIVVPKTAVSVDWGRKPPGAKVAVAAEDNGGPPIDLPRRCSIHRHEQSGAGRIFLARYAFQPAKHFWNIAGYVYTQSINPDNIQLSQYSPENVIEVPSNLWFGREVCPLCGARTPADALGSILCKCGDYICYGTTTPDKYFTCFCGASGFLGRGGGGGKAVVPRLSRGHQGFA